MVLKYFPGEEFVGKKGKLTINLSHIHHAAWAESVNWLQISECSLNDGMFLIKNHSKQKFSFKMKEFGDQHQQVLDTFNHYYGRAKAAEQYQLEKAEQEPSA